MYQMSSIIDTDGGTSVLYHTVHENAFCILIETNDEDLRPKDKMIGVHELFFEACLDISVNTPISDIPIRFAQAISKIFIESNKGGENSTSSEANYAGVALTNDAVYVCTAGLVRIHLIQDRRLLNITRDHNFMSDLLSTGDVARELTFETDPSAFLVPTRTLGHERFQENKPPETSKWPISGEYAVLMCSHRYHKFRNPLRYLSSYLESDPAELMKEEGARDGFLGIIKKFAV